MMSQNQDLNAVTKTGYLQQSNTATGLERKLDYGLNRDIVSSETTTLKTTPPKQYQTAKNNNIPSVASSMAGR